MQRGRTLEDLAPLYGFGGSAIEGDWSGQGQFLKFLEQQDLGLPDIEVTRQKLSNLAESLVEPYATKEFLAGATPADKARLGYEMPFIAEGGEGAMAQFNALASFLLPSLNPAYRRTARNELLRRFATQQAETPDVPFLSFAKHAGYF
jgi:hypothetical protein